MHSKKKNFVTKCVVPNCTAAKYDKDAFCFPISDNNLLLWLYKINNDDTWVNAKLGKTQYICSSHFKANDLESGYENIPMDTLPSLNLDERSRHRSLSQHIYKKNDQLLLKEPLIRLFPLCSVCLKNRKSVTMTQKWDESSKSEKLISDVVLIITGVKVSTSRITMSICDACLGDLRVAYEFRNKFKHSYDVFKQSYSLQDDECEVIDLDNYCDRNSTQETMDNENLAAEVKLEITKQITTIVDTIIMPKLKECGIDGPHEKVNEIELFKALVSTSGKKCHNSTQTENFEIQNLPTPEKQLMLNRLLMQETIETEPSVIILDYDDTETEPVNSLSTPAPVPKITNVNVKEKKPIQAPHAQNNFGIVYPKNIPSTNEADISTMCINKSISVSQPQSNGENVKSASSMPPSSDTTVPKLDKTKQNVMYRQSAVHVINCTPQAKKPRLKNTTKRLNDSTKMPQLIPLLPKPTVGPTTTSKETSVIVSMSNSVGKSTTQANLRNNNTPSSSKSVLKVPSRKEDNEMVVQKKMATSTAGPPITKQPPKQLNRTLNIPKIPNLKLSKEPANAKKQEVQSNTNIALNNTTLHLNAGSVSNLAAPINYTVDQNIILHSASHQNLLNNEQNLINNQNLVTNPLTNIQVMEPNATAISGSYLAPMIFNQIPVVTVANNNSLLLNNQSQVIIASAGNTNQYNDRGYFVYQPQNGQNKLSQYIIQKHPVLPVATTSQPNVANQQPNQSGQGFPAYSVVSTLPQNTANRPVDEPARNGAAANQMMPRIESVQSMAASNPTESCRLKVRNLSELT